MNRRKRAGSTAAQLSDSDLLVRWAAEEFVAAGRADVPEEREAHRRRAIFFADVFECLSESSAPGKAETVINSSVGRLLKLAFDGRADGETELSHPSSPEMKVPSSR